MVRKLTEGVWWVDLGRVNAYLLADDVLTLVDAGFPWQAGAIREAVHEIGFSEEDLERVLLTHFDIDHVGALAKLSGVKTIYAGGGDADFIAKRRTPPFTGRKTAFQRLADAFRPAPTVPITPVEDGEEIGSVTAVHTPGHTSGHVAYVSRDLDVAFVGDLVMSDGTGLTPSPWYLSWDTAAVRRSIEALEDRMPAVTVVAPGHGEPLVGGGYGAVAALLE